MTTVVYVMVLLRPIRRFSDVCWWHSCVVVKISHHASAWLCLLIVLVLQVDGTLGQHPLSCLAEDLLKWDNHTQEIFWRRNGVDEAQRGNLYTVQLVESLGGGNYTCHRVDGTLLNHTEVLILQDESKRRRILVRTEQGADLISDISVLWVFFKLVSLRKLSLILWRFL